MTTENMIFCKKFNEKRLGLAKAPILGPIGEVILHNISLDAWNEWSEMQMKIINEERLDLSEKNAQQRLFECMVSFLGLEDLLDK